MTNYGDEILTLVEIDQPFCQLDYGNSPCQAQLGVTETKKCYNTRFTCQDPLNYDPQPLTMKFSYSQEGINQYGYVIPSLLSVSTSPLRVNIGGMDPNMGAFGERESVVITFADHRDSDLVVDKYRAERLDAHGQSGIEGFDPNENGSFWGKWINRNPYHEKYQVRIKEGVMGDAESSLRVRHYLIDSIEGPTNGKISIRCKDIFSLIEKRKAEAPVSNSGELNANITSGAGSLVLTPTGIGDDEYGHSGHVAISSEIMAYTRATGSDTLTLTERGAMNTEAAAHEAEDRVQEVLTFSAQRVDDIITDLLVNFTEIGPDNIPSSVWSVEAANNLPTLYTANIAKPTSVLDLIGELAEEVGFTMWPDVETDLIELRAIGINIVPAVTVDDNEWVIQDSMRVKRDAEQRVTRVQVFYGLINPLEALDDEKNYRSVVEIRDIDAEDETQYGSKSIRKVFSRWIPQFGRSTATTLTELILNLFRDPPYRAEFKIDVQKAGQLEIASPMALQTRAIVNDLGLISVDTLLPMAINRGETFIEVEAQKLNLTVQVGQERIINIDDDINNVNMRTLHDSLFSPASDGEEVTFIIGSGVSVGGDNGTGWAMRTGSWPTGVILKLVNEAGADLIGPGGTSGAVAPATVAPGEDGGIGLWVEFLLVLQNEGRIAGGGGGGGSANQGAYSGVGNISATGGGGAGINGGALGSATTFLNAPGQPGTRELGGAGGSYPPLSYTVKGGKGGDLAQAGAPGTIGLYGSQLNITSAGGLAGAAIDGDSLVTHLSGSGTITGSQIN